MNAELIHFAARVGRMNSQEEGAFNGMALALFGLQFKYNPAYRRLCDAKGLTPNKVRHWTEVPFVPAAAFKELELSCIPAEERTSVFHSSGTTEQKPSRHFHCLESLDLYETSLWTAFRRSVIGRMKDFDLLVLTPPSRVAPRSSLAHMFETVRRQLAAPETVFAAESGGDGAWAIDFDAALAALRFSDKPKLVLGTAFSFVHLLDFLAEKDLCLELPVGSRVMETGGYKNRSRAMPRAELHSLITGLLGIPRDDIICEYGMSELSSQAYDAGNPERYFHFPPWARVQIVSPESGLEVGDGETGLVRIFDLANVFSVAAIQTEDLAIRRGDGFDLIGRAVLAEARGCSLMTG
ncbi:MAG TPA: hypothetical protein VME24_13170 [Alphaproteobacteria bacterium]|nr:hypothetical protein [Alphaproteobacteria bacterium]